MSALVSPGPLVWFRDRGLVAIATAAAVVAVLYGAEVVPLGGLGVVSWTGILLLQGWTAWQARDIAARPTTPAAVARFWRFVAAAVALFGAGSVTALATAIADTGAIHSPITPVHAICLGLGALFLVLGMVTTPLGIPARRARVRFWLDAATVMVGVGLFAWQLGGLAHRDAADAGTATQSVLPLIGPAALVVVAFGVVKIALGGTTPMTRPAAFLGVLAATMQSVNSAFEMAMVEAGHPTWRAGLAVLTILTLTAGVRVQFLQSLAVPVRGRRASGRSYSRLPYIAVAASYALLIWVLDVKALVGAHAWVVLGGAMLSSALVVVRQLAAFADNDDLLAKLNAKVGELAEAKEVLQRAVDERDALAGRLRHLAYHDNLTGLANRALFLERLTEALANSEPGVSPTVVMIDLDDFKPVNDLHGHHAGDTLLRAVADRLRGCVRDGDTVARLGGDEFAILLASPRPAELAALVRRIGAAVRRPVRVGTEPVEVSVRASIGTATAAELPTRGDVSAELAALLHHADLEMYADKQLSKPMAG
jgi:diguanylate cyclase